jgi:predicted NUDIX family phosphoesterase
MVLDNDGKVLPVADLGIAGDDLFNQDLWFGPRPSLEKVGCGFIHPIVYAVVFNEDSQVLVYKRPDKGEGENRLAGNMSCGIGGHIELDDQDTDSDETYEFLATANIALDRELAEELRLELPTEEVDLVFSMPEGLIYDTSNEVGKVHLGLMYCIEIENNDTLEILEPGRVDESIEAPAFMDIEEALALPNLENWSKIALTFLAQEFAALETLE